MRIAVRCDSSSASRPNGEMKPREDSSIGPTGLSAHSAEAGVEVVEFEWRWESGTASGCERTSRILQEGDRTWLRHLSGQGTDQSERRLRRDRTWQGRRRRAARSPATRAQSVQRRRCRPGARKSNSFGSLSCDGRMSPSARAMISSRPGVSRSHASIIRWTCLRCRFSCEPHRLHGMIGNCLRLGVRARCRPRARRRAGGSPRAGRRRDSSLGGMPASLAWKNRLRKNVATRSSRWWPSAILVKPSASACAVQRAAAQARTQRAQRLAFRHHARDHRVGVLLEDRVRHAERLEVGRQHVRGKVRLLLVEVDRDQLELHRRLALQLQQDVEHRVAVLAAGQAHHHLVAVLDHAEVGDRPADLVAQALGQAFVLRRARRADRRRARGTGSARGRTVGIGDGASAGHSTGRGRADA